MGDSFGWLDVDRIGEELARAYPLVDPFAVRFADLRRMVCALVGFREDPQHPVNERILETIQARWIEERDDARSDDEE